MSTSAGTFRTDEDPPEGRVIQVWNLKATSEGVSSTLDWEKVSGSAAERHQLRMKLHDGLLSGSFFHPDLHGSYATVLAPAPVLIAQDGGPLEGMASGSRGGLEVRYSWEVESDGSTTATYRGEQLQLVSISRRVIEEIWDSGRPSERATYNKVMEEWFSPQLGLFVAVNGSVEETTHPRFGLEETFSLKLDGLDFAA